MAEQQLRWKGLPAPRASQIPPEEWGIHREEICALYEKMKLEDVMVMMKIRHRFSPSRRQYIFQLEKWGVQKYNKRYEPLVNEVQPRGIPLSSSSGDKVNGDMSGTGMGHYVNKQNSGYGSKIVYEGGNRPLVPPKKSQNSDGKPYKICPTLSSSHDDETSDNNDDDDETGDKNDYSLGRDEFQERNQLSPSSGYNDVMEIDYSGPSSAEEYGSCLNEELPPERRLDVSRLIDTFNLYEIDKIKLAADFLFGAQCHEDAFVLYLMLLKQLNEISECPELISTLALIGCARSAATSPQFEIVRSLLEKKLSHLADYSQSSAESFLLRSFLADLHHKEGDEAASEFYNRLAMQSDCVKANSLTSLPQNNRSLDLITYQYLHRLLASKGCLLRARKVTKELLQREPGPFEHGEVYMRNTSVRSCLQWCVAELKRDRRISGSWMNLRQQGIRRGLEIVLGLFCDLWQRWQRMAAKSGSLAAPLHWTIHVEQVMGISPAELLSITCLMMLNACSKKLDNKLFCSFVLDVNLGLGALLGGQKIAAVPDEDLAHAFLEAYSTLNTPAQKGFDNPSHSSLSRDYAKSWLQQSLQLELPEACQSSGPDLSQAIAKCNASQTSIHKSLWPTIASSLSSSDYNSFCSLRDRIHDTFEGALEDLCDYAQMPSDGTGFLSRSNLSLNF